MSFPQGDERRTRIEAALAAYPNIDRDAIEQIKAWFKKEATALDVALLASNPKMANAYRRFRADHIDRFSLSDLVAAAAFLVATALPVAALVWMTD